MSTATIPETVAEACARRHDCRYGLKGVRMRHLPSGREFACGGSKWGRDGGLLLFTREERIVKGAKPPDAHGFTLYTAVELMALEFEPFGPDEIVRAEECILLSRWPVVCCRPGRRRRRP